MLIFDLKTIGNKLCEIRKRAGLTQADVAEKAKISDRAYTDIESGKTAMRIDSMLQICNALEITPDALFTKEITSILEKQEKLLSSLENCTQKDKTTALSILSAFINSTK